MATVDPTLIPVDEAERLAAIRRYDLLDTPPDGEFDRITAIAARIFNVPIAIVSVVDQDRIWFKSHPGLDVDEVDRDQRGVDGGHGAAMLHQLVMCRPAPLPY